MTLQELSIEISIVVPAYNEEEIIELTINKILDVISFTELNFELIIIDDGSTDKTFTIVKRIKNNNHNIRLIRILNNSGHMNAISTGLENAKGNYILTIDADLQDTPELIPTMYKIIKNEKDTHGIKYDVVQASRQSRKSDKIFKRLSASLYYYIIYKLTNIRIIKHAADFRIITREACDIIIAIPNENKILRLLIPKLGLNVKEVPFTREIRRFGKTKYSLKKMFKLASDSIFSFSPKPLRIISSIGIILTAMSIMLLIYVFIDWKNSNTVPGWTSLILIITVFNAFIFLALGVMGEYINRIFNLVQHHPKSKYFEYRISE